MQAHVDPQIRDEVVAAARLMGWSISTFLRRSIALMLKKIKRDSSGEPEHRYRAEGA